MIGYIYVSTNVSTNLFIAYELPLTCILTTLPVTSRAVYFPIRYISHKSILISEGHYNNSEHISLQELHILQHKFFRLLLPMKSCDNQLLNLVRGGWVQNSFNSMFTLRGEEISFNGISYRT